MTTKLPLPITGNQQPAEKPAPTTFDETGNALIEIACPPWVTIQGEGPFAGCRAVFVRLAGCNLKCINCDTDYTSDRNQVRVMSLVDQVSELIRGMKVPEHKHSSLVVITGGEPLRQEATEILTRELLYRDFKVQIETNGSLYIDLPVHNPNFTLVCSPKSPTINPVLARYITAYKYVVAAGKVDREDGLPIEILGVPCRVARPVIYDRVLPTPLEVYLQPEDHPQDKNLTADNEKAAADLCLFHGYRLSLQLHKIVELD